MSQGNAQRKRIAVVGCKHTTLDLIRGLERHGFQIDHCLSIDPATAEQQKVAGYFDLRPFLAEKGIPVTIAYKYSLKSDEDRQALLSLGLDLLLVMGWQRLIPDWWLESLSIGAFGMHGSSKPLPHGRGRSPMNWSLIQGKTEFYTHLFQYKPGVDDGPVVGVQTFDITPFDTCLTLHYKNLVAMTQLCARFLPDLLRGTATFTPQPHEGATYYPKRSDEDGIIYWTDSTRDVYNLIRAVTRPFPGAFSYLDDHPAGKVFIWRAIPFDTRLQWPDARPGEIVEVFYDGTIVVRTGDGTILVQESEGHPFTHSDVGRRLGHLSQPRKVWADLPE
jgi:methionyl-tRNA formyltransferase